MNSVYLDWGAETPRTCTHDLTNLRLKLLEQRLWLGKDCPAGAATRAVLPPDFPVYARIWLHGIGTKTLHTVSPFPIKPLEGGADRDMIYREGVVGQLTEDGLLEGVTQENAADRAFAILESKIGEGYMPIQSELSVLLYGLAGRYGLVVRSPIRHPEIAVLEGLNDSVDPDKLPALFNQIGKHGVRNVVIDLSKFSDEFKALIGSPFLRRMFPPSADPELVYEVRYTGIRADELYKGEDRDKPAQEWFIGKIAGSIDDAVASFAKH